MARYKMTGRVDRTLQKQVRTKNKNTERCTRQERERKK